MEASVVVAVISGSAALVGGGMSWRASSRANAVENRKVDIDEWRTIVAEQREQIAQCKAEIKELQVRLREYEHPGV
jgi:chromosome segregation ATPase